MEPVITKALTLPVSAWAMIEDYARSRLVHEQAAATDLIAIGFKATLGPLPPPLLED